MKRMRVALACVVALTAIALQACGSSGSSPSSGGKPITIAYQVNIVAPFFLAQQKKLFQKNGLDPKFVKFESGPAQQSALSNGNVDIGELGVLPFVSSVANGAPNVGIMVSDDVSKSNGMVVQPDSGITSVADLKGKTVGVPKGSASYYGLLKALAKAHMSLSDIKFRDLQPPVLLSAFQHKDLDAGWIWAPWLEKLEDMGGKRILVNAQVGAQSPSFWTANASWLKKNPDAAAKFVKTMSEAAKMIDKDPSIAAKPVAAVLDLSDEQALKLIKGDVYLTASEQADPSNKLGFASDTTQGVNPTLKEVASFLVSSGTIKKAPSISQLVDPGPAKAAASM
jgi:taurine transport system substrate-binding protein